MERRESRTARERRPPLVVLAVVLASLLVGAGCGDSNKNGEVGLTVGARATPEQQILGQIYAQALRDEGYRVTERLDIDTDFRATPLNELEKGSISGYPDHVNDLLEWQLEVREEDLPSDADQAHAIANKRLARQGGLTAFPPTPFSLGRQIAFLREVAEENGFETNSDLRGRSEEMTLFGFTDCHLSRDCLGGLEGQYDVFFESISYMYEPEDIRDRYKTLEAGDYDAITVYSTDGQLAAEADSFVALEEDKHVFRAGNVIFVTSEAVIEEAGPDYEEAIVAAQEGLTLQAMRRLMAEVELEGRKPSAVAADYLRELNAES